jgi:hypothetical protein
MTGENPRQGANYRPPVRMDWLRRTKWNWETKRDIHLHRRERRLGRSEEGVRKKEEAGRKM